MLRSYRIGKIFGFPIEINFSFFLLLGFIFFWSGGIGGVAMVLVAFSSVLLHELGHALVARRLGVRIAGIELYFFGGAAKMIDPPRSAPDEILIAAAGPAVSFALGAIGFALGALTHSPAVALFGWINVIIGVFNLIPALPMDGGRILRAALSLRFGFLQATTLSVTVARVIAVGFALLGIFTGQLQITIVALVVWMMGTQELRMARFRGYAQTRTGRPKVEVMPPGWRPNDNMSPRVRVFGTTFDSGRYQ